MRISKFFFSVMIGTLLLVGQIFADENLENLLSGYLSNNLELKNLSSQMQKALLENQLTTISKGFSFKLSTGTITFTTGDSWSIKFTPTATFSIPQARGLEIKVSSNLIFDGDDSTNTFSNSSIKLGVNIISNDAKNNQIELLKSERKVLEAKRSLQNGFVSAEKKFYESLKSLYEMYSKYISLEKDLYDHQLTMDTLKAQGYTNSSTKYKSAQMNITNDQFNIDVQKRNMEREVKIFCAECGTRYNGTNPIEFLSFEIPEVECISVDDFKVDDFAKLELVKWNQYINNLQREAESAITLKANAGFTFDNEKTKSSTVDLGTDFTWNNTGLVVSAGTNLPIGKESFTPVFTLNLSFDPNAFKTAELNNQVTELEISQEELDIRNARISFGTSSVAQNSSMENLQWEKSTCASNFEMYNTLESDMARYYRQGYVTQAEYKKSQVNKENYRIKIIVNKLSTIIYNNETTLLFVRDNELMEPETNEEAQELRTEQQEDGNESN